MSSTKQCSKCKEWKPRSVFHVRRKSPDGLAYKCPECVKQALVDWRAANPDGWNKWAEGKREYLAAYRREWYEKNLADQPRRYREWAQANPDKVNALVAKRNAMKKKATPAWANPEAIKAFYKEAARLTKETGIRHEVDHIYPLQSPLVCGLHHEANLQILTRSANARKRNKMPQQVTI